jgi:hypothetical protein
MRSSSRVVTIAALFWIACSSGSSGPVALAPSIIFPEGLLDGVTELKISVYDTSGGALSCNAQSGTVTGLGTQMPLATKDMQASGCPTNAKFCGSISIDESSNPRLFAAQAFVGTGTSPVASGCTSATPNQSTLQVQITMLRTLPPSTCNGMPSAMITQCPTGMVGDPVCDQNCQSLEEYFSPGDGSSTSSTTSKTRPMLAWPAAMADPAGQLIGVWGEKAASGKEVSVRELDDSMEPLTGSSTCIQMSSFRLPTMSGTLCPGQLYPIGQFNPTIAAISGSYYVAFEDSSAGVQTINARSFNPILAPQQTSPVAVPTGTVTVEQVLPSMAANGSNLFVAWGSATSIVGKMISASTLTGGTQQTLGTGTGVTVAATSSGWVASYLNGANVMMVTLDASGNPSTPVQVNTTAGASNPGIAAFGTTVAVIWADGGGNILVQRYTSLSPLTPVAGDQANALQDPSLMGNQSVPSIAAGTNFFIATWVDNASGHVRARFLDGVGGYMFNAVNGQSSDFQASTLNGEMRNNPTAAVGGAGPFVAIAWEDNTNPGGEGIWGRRFPLPQ